MADESVPAEEVPDKAPSSTDAPDDTADAPEVQTEPTPAEQILKHLVILPPLQKEGTLPKNIDEWQDSIPLPPIRAEEPVSSIRAALGDVCGYSHITSFRFELEDPPSDIAKKAGASPSLTKASPYTGKDAVISYPVALKSLEKDSAKQEDKDSATAIDAPKVVLDEYGDLTPFLEKGLKDGSAFRIVLERYDALSLRNHIIRLRLLLEGSAPHSDTLDDGQGAENPEQTENDDGSQKEGVEEEDPPKEETNDGSKDSKQKRELDPKDMPMIPIGKSLSPNVNNLKHFYYFACGEDPSEFLGDDSNSDPSKRENGSKPKKKNKKKKDSKGNSNGSDHEDESPKKEMSMSSVIPELNVLEEKVRVACSIKFSGFHPPPPFRRHMGDLVYFEVSLPDGEVVHVTGTPMGFYINQSISTGDTKVFDPSPAKKPCFSHELLDCLLQHSTAMQDAWSEAISASKRRTELMSKINEDGPFFSYFRVAVRGDFPGYSKPSVASASEGIDSLIQTPSWLVPIPNVEIDSPNSWNRNISHVYNTNRTEEELANSFGVDVRNGALRDWNEELQVAREMPMESLPERIERARMLNKVLTDFGEAALLGVKAISDGSVSSMNPNEPTRSQVYLHNNIFFSRAVDAGIETFKVAKGDEAARKTASRDLQCLGTLHRMEQTGLCTLATVLIDYLGVRYVCQSILPGILNGEKTHTTLYGAVEAATPLSSDKEIHELFENSLGKSLMVATRRIARQPLTPERTAEVEAAKKASPQYLAIGKQEEEKKEDKKEELEPIVEICSSIETKGIRGSDTRKYVLDMTRVTPRDANWISKQKGGTGHWESTKITNGAATSTEIPDDFDSDAWVPAVLRAELVSTYQQMLLRKYMDEKESGKDEQESAKKEEGLQEDEKKGLTDEDLEYLQSLRCNVNVFLPDIQTLEGVDDEAYRQLKNDEKMVRDMSSYLWEKIIPAVTTEIREGTLHSVPHDGRSLTEYIHQRGINCRYLGRLAMLAKVEEDKDRQKSLEYKKGQASSLVRRAMPLFWLELLETEIVARAAKHVLDHYMSSGGAAVAGMPSQTVASFLSALVSEGEETAAQTETRMNKRGPSEPDEDDYIALSFYESGGHGDAVPASTRSRYEVWNDIEEEIGKRFRYHLVLYNRPGKSDRANYVPLLRRVCQRTGIRLAAKSYDIGGKCFCSDGGPGGKIIPSYPITSLDVVDIVPLMKHAAAHGEGFTPCGVAPAGGLPPLHISLPDARTTLEAAHQHHNQKNFSRALELAQEAAGLYQRVTETAAHPGVVRCIDLMGSILYEAGESGLAAANATRALGYQVQVSGFDSSDAINLHLVIFQFYLAMGDAGRAVKHIRAVIYLMHLMGGRNHFELPNAYHKAGTVYHGVRNYQTALRFYQEAMSRVMSDRLLEGMISKSSSVVLASLGDFKGAVESEKRAYELFGILLGENHSLTKNSEDALKRFLAAAAHQGKGYVDQAKLQQQEEAALAIANEIEAEEAAEEERRKKKNQKKKKGKK
ncbi:clustered mitochondria-domain containing protein [Nitzschia inconspicua]|uniref:Clustered mitochondria-domain containing protein n=2 Tax=Nitzschia inconspicua TaxID=303405 RepID=A0A9K3LFU4_9STRA|nr:clustered mitochondria-domain containing protein [Nitzschia inconspicua]